MKIVSRGIFECVIMADGMRAVEPGGNRITSLHSSRTRWPPRSGSKSPRVVMAQNPKGRLAKSR